MHSRILCFHVLRLNELVKLISCTNLRKWIRRRLDGRGPAIS